jgi:hypothetical protein
MYYINADNDAVDSVTENNPSGNIYFSWAAKHKKPTIGPIQKRVVGTVNLAA